MGFYIVTEHLRVFCKINNKFTGEKKNLCSSHVFGAAVTQKQSGLSTNGAFPPLFHYKQVVSQHGRGRQGSAA